MNAAESAAAGGAKNRVSPADAEALGSDVARSADGRWTSPSLGSYDTTSGTNPLDSDHPGTDGGAGEQYFDDYDYGSDYGDGTFAGEFDDDFDDDELAAASDARRNAIEWAVVVVGAVLLALILRAVLLQAFWIPSPSMESTLLVKDRVLVNKASYRLHDIHRGDVVVFRRTDDEIARNPDLPRDVIKRVIGLEGETIAVTDDLVTIDGIELEEPYLDEGVFTSDYGPQVVPEGHIFVMGDNRELSLDSRFETGPISHDRVVGRAFFLFWPLGRMGAL